MPISIHTRRIDIVSTSDMSRFGHPKLESLNFKITIGKEGQQHQINFDLSANLLKIGCLGFALLPFACFGLGMAAEYFKP